MSDTKLTAEESCRQVLKSIADACDRESLARAGGYLFRYVQEETVLRDCGQRGVCRTPPGCARHWEERNRDLVRENEVLRSNCDHLRTRDQLGGTVIELDEAVRLARSNLARCLCCGFGKSEACIFDSCRRDRALIAVVADMKAAVRDRDLARDGEAEAHNAGAEWRTERRLLRAERDAAIADRDELRRALACDGVAARMWLDGWDGMPKGGLAHAIAGLLAERDAANARAERAEADLADLVEQIRDAWPYYDSAGQDLRPASDVVRTVAEELRDSRARAERAEAALAASEQKVDILRDAETTHRRRVFAQTQAAAAAARARFAEEVAAWHDAEKEAACVDRDKCQHESDRQRYRERASVHRHAATHIRAMGAEEPQR